MRRRHASENQNQNQTAPPPLLVDSSAPPPQDECPAPVKCYISESDRESRDDALVESHETQEAAQRERNESSHSSNTTDADNSWERVTSDEVGEKKNE
jgi:hypothetical protein